MLQCELGQVFKAAWHVLSQGKFLNIVPFWKWGTADWKNVVLFVLRSTCRLVLRSLGNYLLWFISDTLLCAHLCPTNAFWGLRFVRRRKWELLKSSGPAFLVLLILILGMTFEMVSALLFIAGLSEILSTEYADFLKNQSACSWCLD